MPYPAWTATLDIHLNIISILLQTYALPCDHMGELSSSGGFSWGQTGQLPSALLVLSCPCRRCEHNCRQDKTVLSRLGPFSNLQLFSLKYIEDYRRLGNWKLSCLVYSCVHTVDADKTRQSCLVHVDGVNCEQAITYASRGPLPIA